MNKFVVSKGNEIFLINSLERDLLLENKLIRYCFSHDEFHLEGDEDNINEIEKIINRSVIFSDQDDPEQINEHFKMLNDLSKFFNGSVLKVLTAKMFLNLEYSEIKDLYLKSLKFPSGVSDEIWEQTVKISTLIEPIMEGFSDFILKVKLDTIGVDVESELQKVTKSTNEEE